MENADNEHRQIAEELKEILPDVRSLLLTLFVANTSNRRADLMALQRARFVIENKLDQVTLERLIKYKQNILKLVERMKRELYPLMGRSDSTPEVRPPNVEITPQICQQPIYQHPPVANVVGQRFAAPGCSIQSLVPNHSAVDDRIRWTDSEDDNTVTQAMINNFPEWSLIPAVFESIPQSAYNAALEQFRRADRETISNNDRESFSASVCSLRSILSDPHILDECWNRWAVNELVGMFRQPINNNNPGWFPVPPVFQEPVYENVTERNPQTAHNVESAQSLRSDRETVRNNNTERSTHHGTQTTFDRDLENSPRPDEQIRDEGTERLLSNQACRRDVPITYDASAPSTRTNEETVRGSTDQSSNRDAQINSELSPRSEQPETERAPHSQSDSYSYHDVQTSHGDSAQSPRIDEETACNHTTDDPPRLDDSAPSHNDTPISSEQSETVQSSSVVSRRISRDNDLSQVNLDLNFTTGTIENENNIDGIRSPASPNRADIHRTPNEILSPTSVQLSNNPVEQAVLNRSPSSSRSNPEMEQDRQGSSVDAVRESGPYKDEYDAVPSTSGEQNGPNSSIYVKLPTPGWQLYRRKSIAVVNHNKTESDCFDDEGVVPILVAEQNGSPHTSTEYSSSKRDTSDLQYIWVLRRKDSFLPSPLIYGMETEKEESSNDEETEPKRRRKRRRLNDEEFIKIHQQQQQQK